MDRNIYKSIRPIFLLSKILGTCPLKLDTVHGYRKKSFHYLWPLCLLIFYTFCVIQYLTHYGLVPEEEYWIIHAVITLNTFTQAFALVLLNAITLNSGEKISRVLAKISEVERQLELLKTAHKTTRQNNRYIKFAVVGQIVHYTYYIIMMYVFVSPRKTSGWSELIFAVVVVGATLNSAFVLQQFIVLIWLLQQRFQWINDDFTDFYKTYKICCMFKSKQQYAVQYLNSLCVIHKKVRDLTVMVQSVYAPTNLVILFKSSISLIFSVHLLLDDYFIHSVHHVPFLDRVRHISNIFTNSLYIIILTTTCAKTARASNQLATLLFKLPLKSRIVATKIWNLFLQAKHGKLTFTCFGLFGIDESLFRTVLGTVAMFSIIIIQFGATQQKPLQPMH